MPAKRPEHPPRNSLMHHYLPSACRYCRVRLPIYNRSTSNAQTADTPGRVSRPRLRRCNCNFTTAILTHGASGLRFQIQPMQQHLAQSKAKLLGLIDDILARPDGMACEENADRVMASFKQ